MSTLLLTLALSILVIIIAIGLLAVGWLLTGKSRIQLGACGRSPHSKKNEDCGSNTSCSLCEKDNDKPVR